MSNPESGTDLSILNFKFAYSFEVQQDRLKLYQKLWFQQNTFPILRFVFISRCLKTSSSYWPKVLCSWL